MQLSRGFFSPLVNLYVATFSKERLHKLLRVHVYLSSDLHSSSKRTESNIGPSFNVDIIKVEQALHD